jgi:catecholate siderophore receptor
MPAVVRALSYAELAGQQAPARAFDIPAGSLDAALVAFERAAGVKVVVAPARVAGLVTRGVTGTFAVDEALRQLLDGTGISFRFTAADTVTLDFLVSEFVAVSGETSRPTNPKFTEPLRDIPQTITVIPREVIEQQGATTLRDVLRNVPGITYQAGEGGGGLPGDKLTLRGFSAENDIFVDGIRDVGAYTRDAFNIEQVEVIKGPASSIGGRGATGGSINLTTKAAHLDASHAVTFGVGSSSYLRGTLDVNQPVTAFDGVSFRINAMWTDAGYPGRDLVENASWGVAPSLGIGVGKPTRLMLNYQHVEQDNVPDYGLSWGAYTDPATGAVYPTGAFDAVPPVDQSNFYGLRDYDFEDIRNDVGTARLEHDVARNLTLRNITRIGNTERDSAITAPRPPNRQLQQRFIENDSTANATSLTGGFDTGAVHHDAVAGVEFLREGVLTYNQAQSTNQPQTNLRRPNPDDRPFGPMPTNVGTTVNDATTNTVGIYLFDTVDLGNRWQVTGGLRWDRSHVDFRSLARATGTTLELERTDRMLSWRGGVVYHPRVNGSVYVGYNTAFNPSADAAATGAALSDVPTAANYVDLEPEKTRSFETGTKWDVAGNRLSLTAAFFHTTKTNARTRNASNEPFVLDGEQRVQGVELSAAGAVADGWNVLAGVAFIDSEIVASANPAELGQDFALTPERSASLWTTYEWPAGLTIGGGVTYQDAVFRNTLNTLSVPSYWLLGATAAYRLNENLTLRVNGDNLTDEQYVDRVGGGHYVPGSRRAVKLSADVRF